MELSQVVIRKHTSMIVPLMIAPTAPRTPAFSPLVWLVVGLGVRDDVLVGRFVIVSEAEIVRDKDSSDVKDVAVVCCVVDADGPCPGKVTPGRVTPSAAHSLIIAAGK